MISFCPDYDVTDYDVTWYDTVMWIRRGRIGGGIGHVERGTYSGTFMTRTNK
jgi:hypothetical protein